MTARTPLASVVCLLAEVLGRSPAGDNALVSWSVAKRGGWSHALEVKQHIAAVLDCSQGSGVGLHYAACMGRFNICRITVVNRADKQRYSSDPRKHR